MSEKEGAMSDINTLCVLPEGAVPNEVLEVCSYFDKEGVRRFMIRHNGDMPLSSTLGLLRLVEYSLIEGADFGDDDDE